MSSNGKSESRISERANYFIEYINLLRKAIENRSMDRDKILLLGYLVGLEPDLDFDSNSYTYILGNSAAELILYPESEKEKSRFLLERLQNPVPDVIMAFELENADFFPRETIETAYSPKLKGR